MPLYQHRFEKVEDYLHHRPPYLFIEDIVSIQPNLIQTRSTVREDQSFINGHFPGAPILPGALMQEMTTQTAGILIAAEYNPMREYNTHDPFFNKYALGVLVRVRHARYRGFARPGDELLIEVELESQLGSLFEFKGAISVQDKTIMQNRFQLANIPSATLQSAI